MFLFIDTTQYWGRKFGIFLGYSFLIGGGGGEQEMFMHLSCLWAGVWFGKKQVFRPFGETLPYKALNWENKEYWSA